MEEEGVVDGVVDRGRKRGWWRGEEEGVGKDRDQVTAMETLCQFPSTGVMRMERSKTPLPRLPSLKRSSFICGGKRQGEPS